MSFIAAREIPQFVTGPQKWDVLGPVGELMYCITRTQLDVGCDVVTVAVALFTAASVAAVAAAVCETWLVVFSPTCSEKARVAARVAPRVKIEAYISLND